MTTSRARPAVASDAGFTLTEVMITTVIMMAVSGIVMNGVMNLGQLSKTVTNRTAMFAGVRNATALLQQEVGQAGRVSLPTAVTVQAAVGTGSNAVQVQSTSSMYVGEFVTIGTGDSEETVAITQINSSTAFTATLTKAHVQFEPVTVSGALAWGVIPKTGVVNGSTDWVLKIVGDINGSGEMVYVEYTCDTTVNHRLYRNQMPFDRAAADKKAPGVEQVLIDNVQPNKNNAACFEYQPETVNGVTFITGVAITLTVESQDVDPVTRKKQKESKALLNVAPRNVFNAWQLAGLQLTNRVQPLPPATALLYPATAQ